MRNFEKTKMNIMIAMVMIIGLSNIPLKWIMGLALSSNLAKVTVGFVLAFIKAYSKFILNWLIMWETALIIGKAVVEAAEELAEEAKGKGKKDKIAEAVAEAVAETAKGKRGLYSFLACVISFAISFVLEYFGVSEWFFVIFALIIVINYIVALSFSNKQKKEED